MGAMVGCVHFLAITIVKDSSQMLALTADRNWPIKEISDLKTAIRRSDKNLRTVLLRASVALCYAHWEGYVRFSAKKYRVE